MKPVREIPVVDGEPCQTLGVSDVGEDSFHQANGRSKSVARADIMLRMKAEMKRALLMAGAGLAAVAYGLLLWRGPWWFDGGHLRERELEPADGVVITSFRTTLVALGAGVVAGLSLYYTHKSHRQTEKLFELSREEQVTGRYVEAMKLLGSDDTHQRLGGIYSLERIMRDSAKDHATVVEVLAAFLRNQSVEGRDPQLVVLSEREQRSRSPEDIQAALTVLCRRPHRDGEPRIDLRLALLGRAKMQVGRLNGVDFERADLTGVDFTHADLTYADFEHSILQEVNLTGADLTGADLRGASLVGVQGLTVAQVVRAHLDRETVLPEEIADDFRVQERIEECTYDE